LWVVRLGVRVNAVAGEPAKLKRRDVLAGLAAGMAGAVAVPAGAATEHGPQAAGKTPSSAAAADQAVPRLLDDHRRAMLAGLADEILPGARAARVDDLLDRVLAVESAAAQRRFLNALGAFDREARDRYGKGWTEISRAQQTEILREASTLASARPAPPSWTRGQPVERPPQPPASPATLRDHFEHLKDWIQRAYYTTAAGMEELGFSRVAFSSFPGCTHPGDDHR
jgi:hypothetical protein